MDFVIANNMDRYVQDGTSTLSCVDARSDAPLIGTPGGDLAEFAMGLYIYHGLTAQVPDYASVQKLFRSFLSQHVTASRPFYFHTDDNRLRQVFAAVGLQLNTVFNILPARTPPAAELNVWVAELVKSYAQGCGHIRLMIDSPSFYGLSDAKIIQWLIRAFYEELWAADTDAKRAKLAFVAKLGPLQGKAVAIVTNNPQSSCAGYSPAIPPNLAGSSLFVFTPNAAAAFRAKVMAPFFAAQGAPNWNEAQFLTGIGALFKTQLDATLERLSPANNCSLISVDVTTVEEPNRNKHSSSNAVASNVALGVVGGVIYLVLMVGVVHYLNSRRGACEFFCPQHSSEVQKSEAQRP
jgi:hypothetical protein